MLGRAVLVDCGDCFSLTALMVLSKDFCDSSRFELTSDIGEKGGSAATREAGRVDDLGLSRPAKYAESELSSRGVATAGAGN